MCVSDTRMARLLLWRKKRRGAGLDWGNGGGKLMLTLVNCLCLCVHPWCSRLSKGGSMWTMCTLRCHINPHRLTSKCRGFCLPPLRPALTFATDQSSLHLKPELRLISNTSYTQTRQFWHSGLSQTCLETFLIDCQIHTNTQLWGLNEELQCTGLLLIDECNVCNVDCITNPEQRGRILPPASYVQVAII